MNVKIIAQTQVHRAAVGPFNKDDVLNFCGKMANICYSADNFEGICSKNTPEKAIARAEGCFANYHNSVGDHVWFTLMLENIPKVLAMMLNNLGLYATSEKSARYVAVDKIPDIIETTKDTPEIYKELSETATRSLELYNKWRKIFSENLKVSAPFLTDKENEKAAMEEARYMLSAFTPTQMAYSTSFSQLGFILQWCDNFIENKEVLYPFDIMLINSVKQLKEQLEPFRCTSTIKASSFNLFDNKLVEHVEMTDEEYGLTYCTNYFGSFAQLAQAQRHRTLKYRAKYSPAYGFYTSHLVTPEQEQEWNEDIMSLSVIAPQGALVKIVERGTVEEFRMKCQERLCTCAQTEIREQTKRTLARYLFVTKLGDNFAHSAEKEYAYDYLSDMSNNSGMPVMRCRFANAPFKCQNPSPYCRNGALKNRETD